MVDMLEGSRDGVDKKEKAILEWWLYAYLEAKKRPRGALIKLVSKADGRSSSKERIFSNLNDRRWQLRDDAV